VFLSHLRVLSALTGLSYASITAWWPGQSALCAEERVCAVRTYAGYFSFPIEGGGVLHFYSSRKPPGDGASGSAPPAHVLVVMHGHPRDANKTFDAAMCAVTRAGAAEDTLACAAERDGKPT
jgi:hypothetical protein